MPRLLLAGGVSDPNLAAVALAAARAGCDLLDLRVSPGKSPDFTWKIPSGRVTSEGRPCAFAGAFVRYDVFTSMASGSEPEAGRAAAWHQAIAGLVLAVPDVRFFNRDIAHAAMNKPAQLVLAARCGLRVPETLITNRADVTRRYAAGIVKPVAGGGFCRALADAAAEAEFRDGLAAAPAIVQPRLQAPEIRIYIVGAFAMAFRVVSPSLDYRERQDAQVEPLDQLPAETVALRRLMAVLRMDFGAADFKSDAAGDLTFLELNTSPMFAAFDTACGGRISDAMVRELGGCLPAHHQMEDASIGETISG